MLGVALRRLGDHAAAVVRFQRSLDLKPGQAEVLNTMGSSLAALGRTNDAAQAYGAALALRPDFPEALFNLGLLYLNTGQAGLAIEELQRAAALQPGNGRCHEALCLALRETGRHEQAVAAGEKAVTLLPQAFTAHHNLGQARMARGDHAGARAAYENALRLNPRSDASWIGFGHACRGLGQVVEAREAYRRAVELSPANPDAHRLLNEMIWQSGDRENYLRSFPTVLAVRPDDHGLRLAYANELLKIGQNAGAAAELTRVLAADRDHAGANDAMARAQAGLGDTERALTFHERAVERDPGNPLVLRAHVETLLKSSRHADAHRWTTLARTRFPLEQGLLAMHTTAQRLVGDADHLRLADFDGIAKVMDIEPPPGYRDLGHFCEDLRTHLEGLHATRAHPTDQTLRGGTQTFGSLFQSEAPILRQFVGQLRLAIDRFIAAMPDDLTHPFFARKSRAYAFSGSWSVRLSSGGFHTNHFHPMGWISSAFYVDVPDVVQHASTRAGWLKMGETNLDLGPREVVSRVIQPRPGQLALFPSYFWHGTVPFESQTPRITIAFDVIPQ